MFRFPIIFQILSVVLLSLSALAAPIQMSANASLHRHSNAQGDVLQKRDQEAGKVKRFIGPLLMTAPLIADPIIKQVKKSKMKPRSVEVLQKREPLNLTGNLSVHRHAPGQGSSHESAPFQKREPAAKVKPGKVFRKTVEILGPAVVGGAVPLLLEKAAHP